MRILITGANGQLGRALRTAFAGHQLMLLDRQTLDIGAPHAVQALVALFPELIIHAAAMTDVDGCERDPQEAYRINALGTRSAALASAELNAALVYISTDYVFDGTKSSAYLEDDEANPISVYGRTKWQGEQFVREFAPQHYIARTAWLYASAGRNFVTRMLTLAAERPRLGVVTSEVGSPTFAPDLAAAIAQIVKHPVYGTYHLVNEGEASRYQFARAILDCAGLRDYPLDELASYPRAAHPPAYGALRNTRAAALGIALRSWQEALRACVSLLAAQPL